MSNGQPNETGASRKPQPSVPGGSPATSNTGDTAQGNGDPNKPQRDEPSLVKLYMEVTAESEAQARSVLMFVHEKGEESNNRPPD